MLPGVAGVIGVRGVCGYILVVVVNDMFPDNPEPLPSPKPEDGTCSMLGFED